jgi:hypothetical protein
MGFFKMDLHFSLNLKNTRSYLLLYTNMLLYRNMLPDDGTSLPGLEN